MGYRKAEMGMGTLIIFIAMILVAAVAAGVLISTTGALQNKALATGKATTQEVGTSLSVVEVYAEDGADQQVNYFYETVKLSSGSDPIRFRDTLLTMNLNNISADYGYDSGINCGVTTGLLSGGDFGVEYQIMGTSYKLGYLNTGDVAKICFNASRSVGEGETVKVTLVPQVGNPVVVATTTPQLMVKTRVNIYP